ncbi:hypothetical protein [Amycolatopsis sp. cmx-4-83]|uniref:hypothetical protein n=1 Tax=Amycolatopsis sp. cmx-4-83 TaxID=2790940 RepID=UPI00397B3367
MDDESRSWKFESAVTNRFGVRVAVVIDIPLSAAWKDVGECAEIAQMAASHAVAHINQSSERPPF